jgi:8-oxo-dGTP diphosphatase
MKKLVEVVGALIWDEQGRFMICQRGANKARPLMWEFVGGKVEKGETQEQALIRECEEELSIEIKPYHKFFSTKFDYPDIDIELNIYESKIISGKPILNEHNDLRWIKLEEAKNYGFCPADIPVVEEILKK